MASKKTGAKAQGTTKPEATAPEASPPEAAPLPASFTPPHRFMMTFPREGRSDQIFVFTPAQGVFEIVEDKAQPWPVDGVHRCITRSAYEAIEQRLTD